MQINSVDSFFDNLGTAGKYTYYIDFLKELNLKIQSKVNEYNNISKEIDKYYYMYIFYGRLASNKIQVLLRMKNEITIDILTLLYLVNDKLELKTKSLTKHSKYNRIYLQKICEIEEMIQYLKTKI